MFTASSDTVLSMVPDVARSVHRQHDLAAAPANGGTPASVGIFRLSVPPQPEPVIALAKAQGLPDRLVGGFEIESLGVEFSPGPATHCLVFVMRGIVPRFEEVEISRCPTYVLRRAGSFAADATRIFDPGFRGDATQHHLVSPTVAKVVSVEKFEVVIAGSNHSLQMILSNNLFFLKNGFERMNVQGRRMTPSYFCLPLVLCDNQLKVILVVAADAVFAIEANGKSVTTDAGIAVRKDTATTVGTRLP
jgi:hypothetical protein